MWCDNFCRFGGFFGRKITSRDGCFWQHGAPENDTLSEEWSQAFITSVFLGDGEIVIGMLLEPSATKLGTGCPAFPANEIPEFLFSCVDNLDEFEALTWGGISRDLEGLSAAGHSLCLHRLIPHGTPRTRVTCERSFLRLMVRQLKWHIQQTKQGHLGGTERLVSLSSNVHHASVCVCARALPLRILVCMPRASLIPKKAIALLLVCIASRLLTPKPQRPSSDTFHIARCF